MPYALREEADVTPTPQELADARYFLLSAGWSAEKAEPFIEAVVAKLREKKRR